MATLASANWPFQRKEHAVEPSSPRNSSAPMEVPPSQFYSYPYYTYAYQKYQPTGRSPDGRLVQPSSQQENATASYLDVHSSSRPSILDSPRTSPRRRGRESEADGDEPGPERKSSKHAKSRHNLPPLTLPPPLRAGSPRLGFIYGRTPTESKCASSPPPPLSQRDIPANQPFTVTASELERLRATTTRTLVEVSSSSNGTFVVRFEDPPAPAQAPANGVPQPAPVERQAEEPARADGEAIVAPGDRTPPQRRSPIPKRPDPSDRALPSFDPVSSQVAKVFRGQLRKALAAGTSDEALYKRLIVPMAGSRLHLTRESLAFTPEFLVAVLLVLPTLDEAQRTTLGNAVGRLRMNGSGKLSSSTRFAIADALEHESVRSRVSLDALLAFLAGTEKTESRRWSKTGDDRPLRYFTNNGYRCGIPQALAKLLARELQDADPQDLAPVLATTRRLALTLAPETYGRGRTQSAVTDAINATSAPAAAKQQVIQEFLLGYLPIADRAEEVELSE